MPSLARINKLYDTRYFNKVETLTFADLTDSDTQQSIDLTGALPAGAIIVGAFLDVTATFTGGTISAMTIDLGVKSGVTDSLLNAADVFTATGRIGTPVGVSMAGFYGAVTLAIIFDSTGGNLDTATTGSVEINIVYIDADKIEQIAAA